jgi:hypothetical protein
VRLVGRSTLYRSLHRQVEQTRAELQAIGVAAAAEAVWLEDVRVAVAPPADPSVAVELEGPLESLAHVLERLRNSPDAAGVIEGELKPLFKKLPKELTADPAQATFRFDDPEWIAELIESAAADVLGRLHSHDDQTNG